MQTNNRDVTYGQKVRPTVIEKECGGRRSVVEILPHWYKKNTNRILSIKKKTEWTTAINIAGTIYGPLSA